MKTLQIVLGLTLFAGLFSIEGVACEKSQIRMQTPPGFPPDAPIYFANQSSEKIMVQWVNFEGDIEDYMELMPGEDYMQPSYESHVWVVSDSSNNCFGPFYVTQKTNEVVIR